MKHFLVFVLTILILSLSPVPPSTAQTYYNTNQGTFAWDAPTKLADGSDIPAGSTVKYQCWRRLAPATVGEKIGAELAPTQYTVSFSSEGTYFLGVEALRYVGTDLVSRSAIAWSDVAGNCQGGVTFGFRYWLALKAPTGQRQVP
jgi:hypothetical protein